MELSQLERLFAEARRLSGCAEYVVVGSLSALGIVQDGRVPARMLMSIDIDCYMRDDPARTFQLVRALGEGSAFEREHGFYLDPVSPSLPTLPAQWEARLVRVPFASGATLFFLDPNDAAVSKYARGEPRDREWIRAGIKAGLLLPAILESRLRETQFLDEAERARAWNAFEEDRRG